MKPIAYLLDKKKSLRNHRREVDQKSIESVFFKVLEKELPNIGRADVPYFEVKDKKTIYCKKAHPAISSEIWRKKEKIKKEINKFFGSESISDIKVK